MKSPGAGLIRHFDIRQERGKVGVILGAVALLNLVLYLTLNLPRMRKESVEASRVAGVTQNLGEVSRRVGLMKDLDRRYESENGKVNTFFNEVLATKDTRMIEIQREVRSIAAGLGMDPETIAYSPELEESVGLIRFGISVPLSGDYRNLRQFINRIENSKNFLIIDAVTLGGARDGGALLDLNIQLSTFFYAPELKAAPATPKARPGGTS